MAIKSSSDKTPPPLPSSPPPRPAWRQALPQVLAVSVKNVLLLGFGMTLGFPTILIPSLSGNNPDEIFSLGPEAISWIGSINLVCVPVGCLLSGIITQPIGRKRAMQFVNLPFLAAWLLFHFSTEVWHVFFALCLTGLTGGLLEAPTLTYVAEVTQPSLRGILSATAGIAVLAGVFSQYLLGTFFHWQTVAFINCLTPLTSFVLLFFIPESPYWFVIKKRMDEAKQSLAWLRGWVTPDQVEQEFLELCNQIEAETVRSVTTSGEEKPGGWRTLKMFGDQTFLWPFALVTFAFFLSHFSGSSPLRVYSVAIFRTVKSPIDEYHATTISGATEIIACTLTTCLVRSFGKRTMSFISLIGSGFSLIIVAICSSRSNVNSVILEKSPIAGGTAESWESWLSTTMLITSCLFSYFGIKLLPWILLGEVFPSHIRATASGITGGVSYVISFAASKTFLNLVSWLTFPGTLWLYGTVSFFGVLVLYFVLPETEGKTLFEITEHFAGNGKLGNDVKGTESRDNEGDYQSKDRYVVNNNESCF